MANPESRSGEASPPPEGSGSGANQEVGRREDFSVSTDPRRLDLAMIHDYLANRSYWGMGRTPEMVRRSVETSLCFGLYEGQQQVGFARVVTDRVSFGWLCDVFVLESHRGRGLSKWLMECVMAHPDLRTLRRIILATRDAHGLYSRYGFTPLANADRWMEVFRPPGQAGSPPG